MRTEYSPAPALSSQRRRYRRHLASFAIAFLLASNTALAAPLNFDISDIPLDIQEGVAPNIIYTLDDSGSMRREYLPQTLNDDGIQGTARGFSALVNQIYYNPTIQYMPAVNEYGVSLGNASPTAAWRDGLRRTGSVDLTSNFQQQWDGRNFNGPSGTAFYYFFDTSKTNGGLPCDPGNPTHVNNSDTCYTQRVISSGNAPFPGGINRTDCLNPMSCTYAEEIQNFANWYSYYRTRTLVAKSASTHAFSQLSPRVRVGYQALNTSTTIGVMREFTGTPRADFFAWLANVPTNSSTPLRNAFVRAGRKYQESGPLSPYAKVPGGTEPGDDEEFACRQNFHIAFTDGRWNGGDPRGFDNEDDRGVSLPNNPYGIGSYSPMAPYRDSNGRRNDPYVADIAFYFWSRDLRPDLDNDVPTYIPYNGASNAETFWNPQNDPANWQHMVNFTVNLGLAGDRVFDPNDPYGLRGGGGDWPALKAGTLQWGDNVIDDLWHAAINSRGGYFIANDAQQLVDNLSRILDSISDRTSSSSAPTSSFPLYDAGTIIFQPSYSPADWTGDLLAIDVTDLQSGTTTTAQLASVAKWSAAARLELMTPASRAIYTWDPDTSTGIRFLWNDMYSSGGTDGLLRKWLNTDEAGNVDTLGSERVNYFRGDRSLEQSNGGSFRNRRLLLGDLVNATPVFIGEPYRFYPDNFEARSYRSFKAANAGRPRRIYAGSNGGMLHAFDAGTASGSAGTGDEVMAYVPSAVVRYLPLLSAINYTHRFYVDGSPTEADVFYNNDWHTVLVAGLNAGGQGVYALDVTSGIFDGTSTDAQARVLWEFTDLDDADLGFTFAQPRVARTNGGPWAVFVGNGYNNTFDDMAIGGKVNTNPARQGRAVLFVLDVETGAVLAKLDTGVGAAQDPTGQNRPNGLSTVETVDINGDRKVDLVYGGDIFGNMWRFDVRGNNPSQWTVSRLFSATYDNGGTLEYQPITVAPRVIAHPDGVGAGVIVLFGTGKHFELDDLSDPSVQTMYGVWDRLETSPTLLDRDVLYEQEILGVTNQLADGGTVAGFEARITTADQFDWYRGNNRPITGASEYLGWYMNLVEPGEKMVKRLTVRNGRLIFTTDTPSSDPCNNGGSSWLMEINAAYGSRLGETPFDYSGGGIFDDGDLLDYSGRNVVGSGIRVPQAGGRFSAPTILVDPTNGGRREKKLLSNSDGTITMIDESTADRGLGRRSWRQIFAD